MQQNKTIVVDTNTVEQTERLAETLGSRLKGGECIELISDLGGGKTTFTRGIVAGAKSNDAVSSPTFTITKVYKAEKFDIHHFDFYRLPDAGLAAHELHDVINDKNIVLIVEWGAAVQDVLPTNRLSIVFDKTGETSRKVTFSVPTEMHYLVESL
jgi:tRNA threonylcarbamoyladenosine biosynthesis protein TsaE